MRKTYNLNDGKYTLVRDESTYQLEAFRHGEPWNSMTADLIGNNLVHALLNRIDDLEKKVSDYGWEASARHAQNTGGTM